MRMTRTLPAALIVGGLLLAVARGQQGASSIGQIGVGVVDMTLVFEKAQMPQDLERIFGQEKSKIEAEAQTKKDRLDVLQKELDSGAFAKTSDDYQDRLEQLETLKLKSELWLRRHDRRMTEERKKWFEQIYRKVMAACKDVAQSQGIDLVLSDNPVDFNVSDAAVLINQILQKKVVYASPRVDLTPLVIERFDNEYLRAGGAASIKLANKSAN